MNISTIPVMRPWFGPEESAAVAEVLASGWVAQGPRVAAFEQALARRVGARHAIAVSSCTAGLHLVLAAHGIGPGDEVIVPSLSFVATANAVRYVGATPVFADVDPVTQNLTVDTVDAVHTPRTVAVMVVHQAGMPADIGELAAWCRRSSLLLLEDAACALGSTHAGTAIGGHGNTAVFSFHPRKVITTGEGGMITTDDTQLAERLDRLRQHGMSVSAAARHQATQPVIEQYLEVGFNFRMSDLQAAVGLVQLGRLDAVVARRREIAGHYQRGLAAVGGVVTPHDPAHGTSNYQGYIVRLDGSFPLGRNEFLRRMSDRGFSLRRGIMAIHLEPAYASHPRGPLPVTEQLSATTAILPVYHQLDGADVDRVIEAVAAIAAHAGTAAA